MRVQPQERALGVPDFYPIAEDSDVGNRKPGVESKQTEVARKTKKHELRSPLHIMVGEDDTARSPVDIVINLCWWRNVALSHREDDSCLNKTPCDNGCTTLGELPIDSCLKH